jgi:hypothetical protein
MLPPTHARTTRRFRRRPSTRSWGCLGAKTCTRGNGPLGTIRALGDGISRDPLGEAGFELLAYRPEKRMEADEKVRIQKGCSEVLTVNPALAMQVKETLTQRGIGSDTKVGPSVCNLYTFVQNEPGSKIDVLGLDIYFYVCWINCKCRWQVGAVFGATPTPVSDAAGYRCCKSTGNFFCGAMKNNPFEWKRELAAAQLYFETCMLLNSGK